ncbi:MAG TPA: VOC family protein, partial [Burkholderiales bacterium]|nr:VOC family protein [Burkholderiales bacterium]
MPEVTGIDHIYVSVTDMARSGAFYDKAMGVLGFRKNAFTLGGDPHVQYFNRHFGFVLRPARATSSHDPYRAGLHHLCLRVETIEDVIEASAALQAKGIDAS